MLYDNIHDFKATAVEVESRITNLRLDSHSDDMVPNMYGRTHVEMWTSMKTVSHFNLVVSLELMLKLLLHLNGNDLTEYQHHCLTLLHNDLPQTFQDKLESMYQECKSDVLPHGHKIVAYRSKETYDPLLRERQKTNRFPPRDPDLWKFRNALDYFDSDAMMAMKRYTWEHVNEGQWYHYIKDISAFVELIDRVMDDIERS